MLLPLCIGITLKKHRKRYKELFPDIKLLIKHFFWSCTPQMIRLFGSVVRWWTMHSEAKHSFFFKQVIRHTSSFKTVPHSLASKHQTMIAYHLSSPCLSKFDLEVSAVSTQPITQRPDSSLTHLRFTLCDNQGHNLHEGNDAGPQSSKGLNQIISQIQTCVYSTLS